MFTPIIDSLFIFSIITPIIGFFTPKKSSCLICGAVSAGGYIISMAYLLHILPQILTSPIRIPMETSAVSTSIVIDVPGSLMSLLALALGLFATIYSMRFMERDSGTPLYYSLLMAMVTGIVGASYSGDLFTLFIFWELMCITSYVLVGFRRNVKESVEAAIKYMLMSGVGSATILFGMSLLYGLTGTLNLPRIALSLKAGGEPWLYASLGMLITGFGIKAAIVPLHVWVPDAYAAAPSPISAIIAGASTELAVFVICKLLFFIFPVIKVSWMEFFSVFAVLNMVLGNIVGLLQNDVKRMLAYSSVAHIGYIFIGIAAGTKLGLTASLLHMFNHGLMKALAFLCMGAIIYRIGSRNLEDMAGIGRRMPITSTAFTIAVLGLIGMPPLNGFISKLLLFMSCLDSGMLWLGILLIIFSAVSTGYYIRILKALIAAPRDERLSDVKEAPILILIPICCLAFLMILLGIWPDPILRFAEESSSWLMEVGRYA
ncbi:MAG: hypothetical protein J7J28_05725 [Thaumarchaeota archaeon]|nr:hypothetical protein [Nitrososphaerota archaeon]